MSLKWESNFSHSWDVLKNTNLFTVPNKTKYITKEDKDYSEDNKSLKIDINNQIIQDTSKIKNNYLCKINYSFNFMRNTFIIVDMSENSILVDFKPNRVKYIFYKLKKFIKDYFLYNFASSLTIIITHNCTAEILSSFSHDPEEIIDNIDSKIFGINKNSEGGKIAVKQYIPGGYFSLYNSLEAIMMNFKISDSFKNDILIINNSLLSYDNSIKNDNFFNFREKFEINVISLEIPFEGLKELANNSGGILLHINKDNKNINYYNPNGDMDEFLFYYKSKYTNIKSGTRIVKPVKKVDHDMNLYSLNYICFCHQKYQKIIYCCPDCSDPHCYIPFYCNNCNNLNIDNSFLQLLLRTKNDIDNNKSNNNKCFPYKFYSYYQQYLNCDEYLKDANNAILRLKAHEKEFKRITGLYILDEVTYNMCPLGFKFKLLYYYIKYEKGKQNFYCDLKKCVLEDNYSDYIDKKKVLLLKDNIRCAGCNNAFDVKEENDFYDIIIYSNCLDIFCLDCYKYLINNNIGCLECND
jgi:hypothetical protein